MEQSKLRRSATAAALSGFAAACYLLTYSGVFSLIISRFAPLRQMFRDATEGSPGINQATQEFQRAFYLSQHLDGLVTLPDVENGMIGYAAIWLVLSIGIFAVHAAASKLVGVLAARRDRFDGLRLGCALHESLQWQALSFGLLVWAAPICILAGLVTVVWFFGSLATNSLVRTSSAFPTAADLVFAVVLFAALDTLLTASWFARRLALESTDAGIFCAQCRYQIGSSLIATCPECGTPARHDRRMPIPIISSLTFTKLGKLACAGVFVTTGVASAVVVFDPGDLWSRVAARSLMRNPAAKSRLVFLLPAGSILAIESPTARAAMLGTRTADDGIQIRVLLWTRQDSSKSWTGPAMSTASYPTRADALRGGEFLSTPHMRLGYSGGLSNIGLVYALPDVGSANFVPAGSSDSTYDWLRTGTTGAASLSLGSTLEPR